MSKTSNIKKLLGLSTTMPLGSGGGFGSLLTGAHLHTHNHGAGCGCHHGHEEEDETGGPQEKS
ncbi:MAG: hypothetical protein IT559_02365 [Alphaproteobacteria bacterium]|nr:hypothetical protein [Alphaproteobacteria bacterium]